MAQLAPDSSPAIVFEARRGYVSIGQRSHRRRKGRPRHGHLTFKREKLDCLPTYVSIRGLSRVLNVKQATIQQWFGHGLPRTRGADRKLGSIFTQDLIAFLESTGRLHRELESSKAS
jgi:hypothetical protein